MKLGTVIILTQVLWCGIGASQPCSSGFSLDYYLFRVPEEHLEMGTVIGSIFFGDCSGKTQTEIFSDNTRYHVDSDGKLKVNTQVTLHNGYDVFSVFTLDSMGKLHGASVTVEHQGRASHQHKHQEDADKSAQNKSHTSLLVLEFPQLCGLQRRNIRLSENDQGPFPKYTGVQIKSSKAKVKSMVYSITGEGADQPPVGLFTVAKTTGELYVTKPLDREEKDRYVLQANAYSPTYARIKEDPMEVIVSVIDQNDNKPIFTQNPFLGSVPETAKKGVEFMTITATDADDPNTENAELRYSILSQTPPEPNPNMFDINPVSGAIRVNADGLDREKYPEYTLEIRVADMQGEGSTAKGQVIIIVTDNNNKPAKNVNWVIPPVLLLENDKGPFPKYTGVQITSVHAKETPMVYSITGDGADQPPVGLFTVTKTTGELYVTKPLDREEKAKYVLQVHAHSPTDSSIKLPGLFFIAQVLDQNDNKPVFTQDPFLGSVVETAKIGVEFMTITATDADDPDTDNADLRYSILSQTPPEPKPNMFDINPVSGAIRVNADGLDREKYPEYTLEIRVADMWGEGNKGQVIITVTDSNDN